MPEVAINYVPDSFQNLKLTVHWETESGESGTNLNYVIDEDTVKFIIFTELQMPSGQRNPSHGRSPGIIPCLQLPQMQMGEWLPEP